MRKADQKAIESLATKMALNATKSPEAANTLAVSTALYIAFVNEMDLNTSFLEFCNRIKLEMNNEKKS